MHFISAGRQFLANRCFSARCRESQLSSTAITAIPDLKCNDKREHKIILAVLLSLSAVYILIASDLARLNAFWSSDCGARFSMVRNWIAHGSLIHLYYPASSVDPTGRINGLAYFLYRQPHGFTALYASLFPFLTGILYRLFGWYGLSVIPVLCGIGALWLLYATARRLNLRCRLLLPLAAGLGTPLLVFSAVYWDHVVMMFLAALAAYWLLHALQANSARFAAFAGAALGLGLFIHELMLALSIAVALTSIPLTWRRDGRRLIVGLLAGLLPFALLWLGTNYLFYGNFAGSHMASNMGANTNEHPYSIQLLLNEAWFFHRSQIQLVGSTLNAQTSDFEPDITHRFLTFAYILGAYWTLTWILGARWRLASILSLIAAGLATYLVIRVHWAHGLFTATPLLIPALAIPWDAARKKRRQASENADSSSAIAPESLFYAWISRACWLFALMALVNPMMPMVGWGNRFLLTMLPLLVILAAHALEEQFLASGRRWRPVVVVCAVGLIGLSMVCQVEGLTMVYRNILYHADRNQQISAIKSPVLVFDDVGISADITAVNVQKPQFLLQGDENAALIASAVRSLKATEFAFVGNSGNALVFSNLRLPRGQYFALASSRQLTRKNPIEDGPDLEIDRFVLKTRREPKH